MLAVSTAAQAAAAVTMHGAAFLIPTLHHRGLSLAQAGLLAACPTVGVMATLVLWGAYVDKHGERLGLLLGLGGTALFGAAATLAGNHLVLFGTFLLLAGACAASTNAASGRVVAGWFPPERRGLAMGIRQMAQPIGVGIGAVGIAVLAAGHGVRAAWLLPTLLAAAAGVLAAAVIIDPPRPPKPVGGAANPYREDRFLARIHAVSILLVVPQFLVWTFALVWLVQSRHWSPGAAGLLVGVAQVLGALSRIAVGHFSDVVGSRVRPLWWVTFGAGVVMAALGATAALGWWVAVVLIVIATMVTVADNGLSFTAVAERAGPFWSGRAMGLQNTAQFLGASLVPPVAGLAVTHAGFATTFALGAIFPLVALPLVPADSRDVTGQ